MGLHRAGRRYSGYLYTIPVTEGVSGVLTIILATGTSLFPPPNQNPT